MAEGQIFIANEDFAITLDGLPIVVHKDVTRVREGHPLLKGRRHLFDPLTVQYDVEKATSAPGERRGQQATAAQPAAQPTTKEPEAASVKGENAGTSGK